MDGLSRRDVLRYGAAATLVTLSTTGTRGPGDQRDFDETYKGKKIKGEHDKAQGKHKLFINGKKLGVMQIELPVAAGSAETYTAVISTISHFDPIPLDEGNNRDGLKKLAKLAVDRLGDQELTAHADHSHD
jgi:hypothetical protein